MFRAPNPLRVRSSARPASLNHGPAGGHASRLFVHFERGGGPMDVEVRGDRLHLIGELDASTADVLLGALAEVDGQVVVMDLSEVSFMDSGGLNALIQAKHAH